MGKSWKLKETKGNLVGTRAIGTGAERSVTIRNKIEQPRRTRNNFGFIETTWDIGENPEQSGAGRIVW